jgi:hypothetical protein
MEREEDGSVLARLDAYEMRLVRNYRVVNPERQDTLLYFSDELVKLERQDIQQQARNVIQLHKK